ncbi:hypothetical protein ACXC9Q_06210 [Kribbella sp. CWNU-51]
MPADAHLQMIQTVIARLAGQSTTSKGWCLTVTAALLSFAATNTRLSAYLAVYVTVAFAALDAYYLTRERAYRTLYQQAVTGDVDDRQMHLPTPRPHDLGRALTSPSIAILYGSLLIIALVISSYLTLR